MNTYSTNHYDDIGANSAASAREFAAALTRNVACQSVVDVGCGIGLWLKEFAAAGVGKILGYDGVWVDARQLVIPSECFQAVDLAQPLVATERFDLALCMEVAEHLPPASAETLVKSLTGLADVVVFSAAIPYQPGFHHLNCQWPDYWAQRFARQGYVASDCLRPLLWNNPQVTSFYKQNAILYIAQEKMRQGGVSSFIAQGCVDKPERLVHPDVYMTVAGSLSGQLSLASTPGQAVHTLRSHLQKKLRGPRNKPGS